MLLTVCVNGARTPEEHPALSADPDVVAADAACAVAAGAHDVHLHPQDADGRDSLRGEDVARWLAAFRAAVPGVALSVTTGPWAAGAAEERLSAVEAWTVLPDLATVNWHEEGAEELAALLLSRGVGVEAGLWTPEAAREWTRSPLAPSCRRALVEVPDLPAGRIRAAAQAIVAELDGVAPHLPLQLHGEERSTWSAVLLALEIGADTRIGLEDTLTCADGTVAASNAELVRRCRDFLGLEEQGEDRR